MKKSFLNIAISLFACMVLFNSCKKDDPLPEENPVVNTTPPIFNWKLNNTTSLSSDSTFAYQNITTIFAYKGGNANSLEIELTSLNTGTYSISSATGNAFTPVERIISIENAFAFIYGKRNSYRIPAYHRMDLSLNYTPIPKRKPNRRWQSSYNFSIYNLYSRKNTYFIYYKLENGNTSAKTVSVSLFPIIPSFTWNFKF